MDAIASGITSFPNRPMNLNCACYVWGRVEERILRLHSDDFNGIQASEVTLVNQ
jgi:hypothetical protein